MKQNNWLFLLNFFILQWFFIRLDKIHVREYLTHGFKWKILIVAPLSGWWDNYILYNYEKMKFMSWVIAYISIAGVIINIFKNPFCFVLWLLTNGFWCLFNIINKLYSQAFIFLIYFLLSIFGLIKWIWG
jgi:hypothetical protein